MPALSIRAITGFSFFVARSVVAAGAPGRSQRHILHIRPPWSARDPCRGGGRLPHACRVPADRLDRRQLNRATLARQLLLRRADVPAVEAVEHLVGLQSQAPLAHYVGLWSRLVRFDPAAVGAALERGELVRTHAMRVTVHLLSRRDAIGLRALLQPMLLARFGSSPFAKQLPGVDLAELARLAREALTAAPLSRVQLGRLLGERFPGVPADALAYAAVYVEPLAQLPPRGVWGKRGPVRWQTFRGWLGAAATDHPAAVEKLVLRYLAAFGPASVSDLRTWSGLAGLREVADRMAPRLRTFLDDAGRELLDLPDAPRPDPETPAPVRFLPEYDNVLLSHQDRRRVIPDGRAVPLPPGDGARVGTVLVDGDFRASWRVAVRGDATTLAVHATPPLSPSETDEVTAEARALVSFLTPNTSTVDVTVTG
jgi:DNA glycosylase AlkZ-like